MNKIRTNMDKRISQLPNWLWANSSVLPSVYRRIWEAVKEDRPEVDQGEILVDTKKVFPLLLTSQLPTEVLGYIWGLANQKYAGKLTEQELYVVLALIAVAQTSHPFASLEVLHLLPGPPVPRLNLNLICPNVTQTTSVHDVSSQFQDSGKNQQSARCSRKSGTSSIVAIPILPGLVANNCHMGETRIDSKITGNQVRTIGEIITESKRTNVAEVDEKTSIASTSVDSGDDFSEFQSCPMPQIQPSIPILKQGSAIGSRLANHNLGVKKTIEKGKKNSSTPNAGGGGKNHVITGIRAPPGVGEGGSRSTMVARESSTSNERLGEFLFPKCSVKTTPKMLILKDTVIRNNSDSSKPILANVAEKSVEKIDVGSVTRQSLKIVSNSTSASSRDSRGTAQDLMNLREIEDKYSALRILVQDPEIGEKSAESNLIGESEISNQSDDFGDFVSAEQPENGGVAAVVSPRSEKLEFNVDDSNYRSFTDFERFGRQFEAKKSTDVYVDVNSGRGFGSLHSGPDVQGFDEKYEKYEGILETEKVVQKEDALSVNSIELGNGTLGVRTRSNSVPSLDLKSFLSPGTEDEQQQMENMHQLIYWEWKRYMESCVLVLQTAANVFGSITSDSVLQQVLASARGYNFLCNLAEVAAVCRRVNFSHKEMDINIMGFDDLLMDIDRIWAEMEPFYTSIPIVTELPVWPLHQNDNTTCCALCLTVVTSGRIVYNDNSYHVTCANLWLNCVNSNLPALRYPPSSFTSHQHSVAISSTGGS